MVKALRLIASKIEEQDVINLEVKEELEFHAERIAEIEAKIAAVDESYYSVKGYCNLINIQCPEPQANTWGRMASKTSRNRDIPIGKTHHEKYGQVNTYHIDVLKDVIGNG